MSSKRSRPRPDLGRALRRLEPHAPPWLVAIVKPKPAAPPWPAMIRFAISVGGALLAGVLVGQTALGGLLATGALTGAFGDQGGPLGQRLRRTAAGCGAALVGLLLSRVLLVETGPVAILVVAAVGVVSAGLSAISAVASFAALQLLVMMAVGAGFGAAASLPVVLGAFVAGALWSALLTVVFALARPERDGPRSRVVTAWQRLADFVDAVQSRSDLAGPRAALGSALADAWDAVTAARSTSPGRRDDLHRLSATLGPAAELARAAAADRVGTAGLGDHVRAVIAVLSGARGPLPDLPPVGDRTADAALDQVSRAIAPRSRPPGQRPRRRRSEGLLDRLLGRSTAVFAARLALCLAVAETLRALLPLSHPYWLLLTVAVVLKPDLGSVFARGVQRTLGTVVGVLLGTAVLAVVPPGPLLLIPVVLIAFAFPYGAARNYGMLSTFLTPLVLILVDLAGGVTRGLGVSRLIDTLIGAAVVLLVGYLPWPSTWRPRLGRAVATAMDALTAYAAVAVGAAPTGPARRRAFAALQDLRSDLQSALAEPPPGSRTAAAWWPVLGPMEQIADDLRSAALIAADPDRREHDTAQVVTALRDTSSAMRAGRRPKDTALPPDGPLAAVAADVAGLRRVLDGPAAIPRRAHRGVGHRPSTAST